MRLPCKVGTEQKARLPLPAARMKIASFCKTINGRKIEAILHNYYRPISETYGGKIQQIHTELSWPLENAQLHYICLRLFPSTYLLLAIAAKYEIEDRQRL
jgi:hypothetical protein